jgi:putative phage-type endonuclease
MFKFIELEQDTAQWLEWRKSGITATDAAIIMGHNPYEDIDNLFLVKSGLKKAEFKMNEAIQRGKDLEPVVRAKVNNHFQENFNPACVQNLKYDYMIASLDGISSDGKWLLEIKCPSGFGTHKKNIDNIPPYYATQVQYQLLCTGAECALFTSYFNGDMKFSYIYADTNLQKDLIKNVTRFWLEVKAERLKNEK